MKTQDEINTEIELLKAIKPKVRRFTAFGDDNWKSIDAQIITLERKFDEDAIYDRYDDPNTLNDALLAHNWMRGLPIEDFDGEIVHVADTWKDLVRE